MYEVSKYSFSCPICGKKYCIKGYWWNQIILHNILYYAYEVHLIKKHQKSVDSKFLTGTLMWIPLVVLQILDIPLQILRMVLLRKKIPANGVMILHGSALMAILKCAQM